MKNLILLFLFISSFSLQANTLFVMQGGSGNGSSWTNALGSVQEALAAAKAGDQIWVAKGKYLPTNKTDRNATFSIPNDVALYGGFAGTESVLTDRKINQNQTILSGEIGSASIDDNSYTVVYTKNVSAKTIIDGFTVQGGAANGKNTLGSAQRCGGALFNDASNGISSPTIRNCIFRNNYAREGAGIYNNGKTGKCLPTIANCTFTNNKADLDGGAIFNNGDAGVANPIIIDCKFIKNEATYGGAILNQGMYQGQSSPSITACTFSGNISYLRGGSLYNNVQGGECEPLLKACTFADNQSTVGKENKNMNNHSKVQRGKSTFTVRKKK